MQHFFSPTVSPYSILAVLGWLAGVTLTTLGLFVSTDDFGHLGLLIAAGSAVLNVRNFVHQMERREVEAFELGRASVRPLR